MLMQEIESKKGKPFDLTDVILTSISNIICSIVFGKRFEYNDIRFIKFVRILHENFSLLGPSSLINIFPFLKHIPGDPCKGKLILRNVDTLEEFLEELIKEHNETYDEETNIHNYIDAYLKEQKQGRETFTDFQLIKSIADMFAAGTETTATAVKWVVLYLLHHPNIQSKLREDIDNVIGTSRTPSLEDRVHLPFCQAFITEALRCGNIAPLSLQHSCQSDLFQEYRIPKGAVIIPNLDSVLNDEHLFKDPSTFDPERFIDENGKFHGHEKVVAFSVGRRVCLGESLARSELFLVLTSMVQRFYIVAEDENNLPSTKGLLGITRCPKPFKFCAIKRDSVTPN